MAKRKATRKRSSTRRRRGSIGSIAPRRRASNGGGSGGLMQVLTLTAGVVGGQMLGKMLGEKVPQLADGKVRGAVLLGVGILGQKYVPAQLKGVAMGVAVSGGYQLARELMPQVVSGGIGQLSSADVDLIESMALESERVNGLERDMAETVTGDLDTNAISVVTGADDDDDDSDSDY